MRKPANEDRRTGAATRRSRAVSALDDELAPEERSFSSRPPRVVAGASEIAILDEVGRIVAVNRPWRKTVAAQGFVSRTAGVGALYGDLACEVFPDLDPSALELTLLRLLSGAVDEVKHTFSIQARGGPRWREVQITRMSVGTVGRFVASHSDQTPSATALEALKVTSEQLLAARDEERQRIAIELHDSTSQHLAAMSLSLARLRRTLLDDEAKIEIVDEITASLNEAVKETRVLSYLMKPRDLGHDGLTAAARQFLEGLARRTGLEVTLEATGAVDSVPAPLQYTALRIIQEALLNASRHAQAQRVAVELSIDDGLLKVSVADDGHGMRTERGEPSLGVGIPGMHARAEQFSGDLAISSNAAGTRVVALFPLRRPRAGR